MNTRYVIRDISCLTSTCSRYRYEKVIVFKRTFILRQRASARAESAPLDSSPAAHQNKATTNCNKDRTQRWPAHRETSHSDSNRRACWWLPGSPLDARSIAADQTYDGRFQLLSRRRDGRTATGAQQTETQIPARVVAGHTIAVPRRPRDARHREFH